MINKLFAFGMVFVLHTAAIAAHAEGLSWNYTQLSYQTPEDNNVEGIAGELSVAVSGNWILQGEVSYVEDDGRNSLVLSQTRYDLRIGRVFPLSQQFSLLASAGYTHVEYRERLNGNNDHEGFDAANLQVGVRGQFGERFEADAQLGVLVDADDVSDLLYELAVRYHLTDNVAINLGIIGTEDATSFDEVMYEVGFRFDLGG